MKVLIAGEGSTELGDWFRHPTYRSDPRRLGVIERLVTSIIARAQVIDGIAWKDIRKYRAGKHRSAEERNVLGLALKADEVGARLVAFSRDRDGEAERASELRAGVEKALELFPNIAVAGGVAVESIESWLLSLLGHRNAERLSDPKTLLEREFELVSAEEKADVLARGLPDSRVANTSLDEFLAALEQYGEATS